MQPPESVSTNPSKMQGDAWHDALPLLKLGSGIWRPDMADITAIQHTGESAM